MKKLLASLSFFLALVAGCGGNSGASRSVPAAPTAVTATAGNNQVTISWTASSGATSYNIYFGTAPGVTPSNGSSIATTATSYTQTGLTNGTAYYYVVTAFNGVGESSASAQATATPVAPAPLPPTAVMATAGNAKVSLTWTGSSGATSYNVYYAAGSSVSTKTGTKVAVTSGTTASVTGLTNGTLYSFIVTAVNAVGESAASATVTATPVAPIPAAPTGLTATAGNAQVGLTWTGSSGATSYNVYYAAGSTVSTTSGTKMSVSAGTTASVTGLTNGVLYAFVVTAVNSGGESGVSNVATATPTTGVTVSLTPGTPATATLQLTGSTALTFNFPANAVSEPVVATISPISQADLPVPLTHGAGAGSGSEPKVELGDTFLGSFSITLDQTTITTFNAPVGVSGSVGAKIPSGSTVNLATLRQKTYVDVATFVVQAGGAVQQNLPSVSLPGVTGPSTYLFYEPQAGSTTSVSNLGVALIADDGLVMADGSDGVQVVHIYDSTGGLLPTPTVTYLDYPGAGDLDGDALTPDGSQGILVDGGNTVRFFSKVQTGIPAASTNTVDISNYGGDGDSVAILPNGDEAVVSGDSATELVVVSGILAGAPVATTTIPVLSNRDGLTLSNDGKVLLARGPTGLTVFAIAAITPAPGTIGGTISHSFTQVIDLPALGSQDQIEDGREGMGISPVDSSRAVVVVPNYGANSTIQLVTGLTSSTPVAGTALTIPGGAFPTSVAISPDGKLAVVGTYSGLLLYSGVDTGTLTAVGSLYSPTYTLEAQTVKLSIITTLGITLDGKYVLAGDQGNAALVVVPVTASGFAAAPASVLGSLAIPYNDQLLVH